MPGRGDADDRGSRRPNDPRPGSGPGRKSIPRKAGGLNLRHLGGDEYELIHPRCVEEMEPDYAEGMELLDAGDVEAARDALRYALQGCGDNLYVHVALGRIALEEFREPALARGHYGYAFELAQRAFPLDFQGRLDPQRVANRPYFEAIRGLSACYDALGKPDEAAPLRALLERLGRGRRPGPKRPHR
jgi:tetratricopeptide (TPR) repeat protein